MVNKVILLGTLGKDPEVRNTNSGAVICNLSLATSERRKSQAGEWEEHTEWHKVVIFGKTAENAVKYLKKGSRAFVEGKIRTNKYKDKDGAERYSTEIVCEEIKFLGSKQNSDKAEPHPSDDIPF